MPKGRGYSSEKKRAVRAYTYKFGTANQKAKLLKTAKKRSKKRRKKR